MPLRMQEVKTDDALRYKTFNLFDTGTLAIATAQSAVLVDGLNGRGGTIVSIKGRCVTTPTGTTSATRFDININGTSMFVSTTSMVYFTKTTGGAAATTVPNVASGGAFSTTRAGKVYNGDLLSLDCDAKANGAAGAMASISIVVRCDEPND